MENCKTIRGQKVVAVAAYTAEEVSHEGLTVKPGEGL